jgi:exodeoxyribonuclease V alpha subunit
MTTFPAQPRVPAEEIAGLVERVTFFNPESGFAVLRVDVRGQREPATVLGSLPSVSAGEWLTAEGWWVRDKEHGLQFKAKILKTVPPTTSEGVERFRCELRRRGPDRVERLWRSMRATRSKGASTREK